MCRYVSSVSLNVWGKRFKLPQLTHESNLTIDHSCKIFFEICYTRLPRTSKHIVSRGSWKFSLADIKKISQSCVSCAARNVFFLMTPRFWQISWMYSNQGGQIMPPTKFLDLPSALLLSVLAYATPSM